MLECPLVCPFCNELAYRKKACSKIMLPHKIYVPRKCIMGHEFYSVEEVPENQSDIVKEIKEILPDAREWKRNTKSNRERRRTPEDKEE